LAQALQECCKTSSGAVSEPLKIALKAPCRVTREAQTGRVPYLKEKT
jgi:hypothetical protein